MKKFTLHFLILALVTGIYGFGGFELWGTEVSRVVFLIFADLLVVSIFARMLFRREDLADLPVKAQNVAVV